MDASRTTRLQEALNNDAEFQQASRFWNTNLKLDMGNNALLFRIQTGQVTEIERGYQDFDLLVPSDIQIHAPAEQWDKFLQLVPKPFYLDLWGATVHHGFKVGGDLEKMYAYYPAVRRFFDVMREVTHNV